MATTTKMTTMPTGGRLADEAEKVLGPELARIDGELRAFVKERPMLALLGAVAAGYFVGRILRRHV